MELTCRYINQVKQLFMNEISALNNPFGIDMPLDKPKCTHF